MQGEVYAYTCAWLLPRSIGTYNPAGENVKNLKPRPCKCWENANEKTTVLFRKGRGRETLGSGSVGQINRKQHAAALAATAAAPVGPGSSHRYYKEQR